MIRFRALFVLVPVCSFVLSCSKPTPPEAQHSAVKLRQLEGYPVAIIHAIADQGRAVSAAGGHVAHLYQLRSKARTWPANHK
jgi:hypothetical protein